MGRTTLLKVTSWPNAAPENTSRQQSAVPIARMIALLDNVSIRKLWPTVYAGGHLHGFTHQRMISRAVVKKAIWIAAIALTLQVTQATRAQQPSSGLALQRSAAIYTFRTTADRGAQRGEEIYY